MWGGRYFGKRHYGARYWGVGVAAAAPMPTEQLRRPGLLVGLNRGQGV